MFNLETKETIATILNRMQKRAGDVSLLPDEHRVMNGFLDEANSDLFGIYLFDQNHEPHSQATSRNYDDFIKHYESFRAHDPILRNVLRHGSISESSDVLGRSGWERHPLCQLMSNWKLNHSLQAPLKVDGKIVGTVNLARRLEKGRFQAKQITWIWELSQAISLIFENNLVMSAPTGIVSAQEKTDASLEQKEFVFVTSSDGTILSQTLPLGQVESSLREAILQAVDSNLRTLKLTGHIVATKTINAPPPEIEQFSVITSYIPSAADQFISTVVGLSVIAPQVHLNLDGLAPRTKKVAICLLRGYSNKMIAQELQISENTVKDHIRKLYARFGVHNKTEFSWMMNSPLKIS